jgi:triosephosphate isomerase
VNLRRKLIVGNWKMNGSLAALAELAPIAEAARAAAGADVAICPPFTLIAPALARGGGVPIGAQDCHHEESGAHTGCVSAAMLKEAGARLVIVGHSERRADQSETDALVRAKAEAALRHGLTAIACVGESEAQRFAGEHVAVVTDQLGGSLPEEAPESELVVAYEPIWAIGTGIVATPADVALMHNVIRKVLAEALRRARRPRPHPLRRLGQARQRRRAARRARRRRRPRRRRQPHRPRLPADHRRRRPELNLRPPYPKSRPIPFPESVELRWASSPSFSSSRRSSPSP